MHHPRKTCDGFLCNQFCIHGCQVYLRTFSIDFLDSDVASGDVHVDVLDSGRHCLNRNFSKRSRTILERTAKSNERLPLVGGEHSATLPNGSPC